MERPPTPFLRLFPIVTVVELLLQGLLVPSHPITDDLPEFPPLLAFFSSQSDLSSLGPWFSALTALGVTRGVLKKTKIAACLGLSPRHSDLIRLSSGIFFFFFLTLQVILVQSRLRTTALGCLSTVVASTCYLLILSNSPSSQNSEFITRSSCPSPSLLSVCLVILNYVIS